MARGPIKKTRTQELKAEKYETYIPPSSFDIPQEVIDKFEDEGMRLRWIRIILDGQDDYKNVAKRRREGYEPVSINELPDHVRDLFDTKSFGPSASKFSNIATVGARQRYYEQLALNNELAQRRQLGGESKLNKLLPIHDESKTEIRTGNRQNAPQEFGKTLKSTSSDSFDPDE